MASKGTVQAAQHFDPAEDCRRLHKAMAGLGTNEKVLIEIIAKRSAAQRQILIRKYEEEYRKPLVKELQKELSGDFEKLVVACMDLPINLEAKRAHKAVKGLGTNEAALVEVICTKNNFEIEKLKAAYQHAFERSLIEDVRKDTSGDFQKVLLTILRCERDDTETVDREKAEVDAKALFKAGEGRRGTDENVFTEILCKRNFKQLRIVLEKYEHIAGHDFEKALKDETSGDLLKAYTMIACTVRGIQEYYADKIHATMKGLGTKDDALIRYIVTRLEIDLFDIKEKYHQKYNTTMEQDITKDTSGDYRAMLLELIS